MTRIHPRERRVALDDANKPWTPRTLAQHIDACAERYGDDPFVITDEATYSYRQIRDWSRRLALGLVDLGIEAGEHVAVVMANHPEFVALKFAIARIGATCVPINFLLRERELGYVLEQSDAVALITMDRFRDLDYVAMLDTMMPGWETGAGGDAFPGIRQVVVFSADGASRDWRALGDLEAPVSDETIARLDGFESDADDSRFSDILYTSGTTGSPKGVLLRHNMVLRCGYSSAYGRALTPGHRVVFSLPMYHVFGYVECMLAVTFVGGAIVPHTVFDPAATLAAIARHRANEIVAVPTMTWALLDEARANTYDLENLSIMYSSGGAAPPSIWDDIRSVLGPDEVAMGYGQTETTAAATCHLPEDHDDMAKNAHGIFRPAGIAGDPSLGGALAEYKTVDLVTGADLPRGERGELMVRGVIVTPGYYNKPDETAATIDEHGWLHTGDIGIVDEDDYVHLVGRVKETYRCGGEMVMPAEIEQVLTEHPGVAQAHVAGIPHERMGEIGCAFVVVEPGADLSEQDLIDRCAAQLARFKVPRHVLFVTAAELPLTVTGRVQKFRLVEMAAARL